LEGWITSAISHSRLDGDKRLYTADLAELVLASVAIECQRCVDSVDKVLAQRAGYALFFRCHRPIRDFTYIRFWHGAPRNTQSAADFSPQALVQCFRIVGRENAHQQIVRGGPSRQKCPSSPLASLSHQRCANRNALGTRRTLRRRRSEDEGPIARQQGPWRYPAHSSVF